MRQSVFLGLLEAARVYILPCFGANTLPLLHHNGVGINVGYSKRYFNWFWTNHKRTASMTKKAISDKSNADETSPEKSTWPGLSIKLIILFRLCTSVIADVFIVIPRICSSWKKKIPLSRKKALLSWKMTYPSRKKIFSTGKTSFTLENGLFTLAETDSEKKKSYMWKSLLS